MDVIKKFYELVRIKQIFTFLVKAQANEKEYIPFILDKKFINTSFYNILPTLKNMLSRCVKIICVSLYDNEKRKKECDNVTILAPFKEYLNTLNKKSQTIKLKKYSRKRKSEESQLEDNTNKNSKVSKSQTTDISGATIKVEQMKNSFLAEFREKLEKVRQKYPSLQRWTRANTESREPFLKDLKNLQDEYMEEFIKNNFSTDLLDIPELNQKEPEEI